MSWRVGSSPPTMWRAVRTTLCKALWLPAVLFPNQAVMQPVRMLSQQCRSRRTWGYWDSFQTSSAVSGRRDEALMCLLQHCICVSRPCEILGDVNCDELKAVYPLHRCLVDGDGCVFSALSPEIYHQLLGLVDVEWEVVLLTPFSQSTHLLSVGWWGWWFSDSTPSTMGGSWRLLLMTWAAVSSRCRLMCMELMEFKQWRGI